MFTVKYFILFSVHDGLGLVSESRSIKGFYCFFSTAPDVSNLIKK